MAYGHAERNLPSYAGSRPKQRNFFAAWSIRSQLRKNRIES